MTAGSSAASSSGRSVAGVLLTVLVVLAGGLAALQAQLNGALTERSGSVLLVSLISFALGTVLLGVAVALRGDLRGWRRWFRAGWRPWWLLNGLLGTVFVVSISAGVPVLGVALATVLTVAGQTVAGVVLDSRGTGIAGRLRLSRRRAAAVTVAVLGLGVSVLAVPAAGAATPVWVSAGLVVVLIVAGVASSVQQAANGAITGASGSPVLAAFLSFGGGTVLLGLVAVIFWLAGVLSTVSWPSPVTEWWLYSGGLLGAVFIVTTAFGVRRMGVLALSLAVIAGQLSAAVALDVALGRPVTAYTLISVAAVVTAVTLAVSPRRDAPPPSPFPPGAAHVHR